MKKIKFAIAVLLTSLCHALMMILPASAQPVLVSPPTGDNSYLILMIGAAVCVVLIAIVIAMGKRRK